MLGIEKLTKERSDNKKDFEKILGSIISNKEYTLFVELSNSNKVVRQTFTQYATKNTELITTFLPNSLSLLYNSTIGENNNSEFLKMVNEILSVVPTPVKKEFYRNLPRSKGLQLLQDVQFAMLKVFSKICKEHNINCMIGYGTLLGAIRHLGWIPWDDDIDLIMFENEVKMLKEILKGTIFELKTNMIPAGHKSFKPMRYYWIKLRGIETPLYIDIFPVMHIDDGVDPASEFNKYCKYVSKNTDTNPKTYRDEHNIKKLEKYFEKFECGLSKNNQDNRTMQLLMRGNINIYNSHEYDILDQYEFCGETFLGPSNPETSLNNWYGDYYKLPNKITPKQHSLYDGVSESDLRSILKLLNELPIKKEN